MNKLSSLLPCVLVLLAACVTFDSKNDMAVWKAEIIKVEKEFNDLAQEDGIAEAFNEYAAADAVIQRNDKLIIGKTSITEWYRNNSRPNTSLTWAPDYVDVSRAGDLAYTYGTYVYTFIDSTNTARESSGSFHTVWKRQEDGNWRFVWD